jgi:hypothetical protein
MPRQHGGQWLRLSGGFPGTQNRRDRFGRLREEEIRRLAKLCRQALDERREIVIASMENRWGDTPPFTFTATLAEDRETGRGGSRRGGSGSGRRWDEDGGGRSRGYRGGGPRRREDDEDDDGEARKIRDDDEAGDEEGASPDDGLDLD